MTLYLSKNRSLRRAFSYQFSANFPNIFRTAFSQLLLYFPTTTFYVVLLEYVLTSRTGWKKNEREVVMSVQLNERWKQEQLDNWLPIKSASSNEQAPKNEKRQIERTTRARELFSKEICCNLLVYRPSCVTPLTPPHPYFENNFFTNGQVNSKRKKHRKMEELRTGRKMLQWIKMKTRIELKDT